MLTVDFVNGSKEHLKCIESKILKNPDSGRGDELSGEQQGGAGAETAAGAASPDHHHHRGPQAGKHHGV